MNASQSCVLVVDDDNALREALGRLFRSVGLSAQLFSSAAELIQAPFPDGPTCLVLDVRMPGLSGLDLQSQLSRQGRNVPIVFMTGHGDVPMSVQAMKAGAVDFLSKPFRDQEMLDAVTAALERDRVSRRLEASMDVLRARFETLTPREREVFALVARGLLNKQIAHELGLAEVTVKIHRGNMMQKLGARGVVDLIGMADELGVRRLRRDDGTR
ncbi:response regulator transcription factor [Caulobacter sp. NIBR2454]|uniref:response regulator transcription factor n=1 Tax=Caulobacter sp. NIBR2454 TaxID=3015996 RepID=UPI0022B65BB0|nr:response regulator transcription factor [Caulobacter sp. NIBR2454]